MYKGNSHASNWLLAQTTDVDVAPENLHAGTVREIVLYFKLHEVAFDGSRSYGGRKSPSPNDLAHGLYNKP